MTSGQVGADKLKQTGLTGLESGTVHTRAHWSRPDKKFLDNLLACLFTSICSPFFVGPSSTHLSPLWRRQQVA